MLKQFPRNQNRRKREREDGGREIESKNIEVTQDSEDPTKEKLGIQSSRGDESAVRKISKFTLAWSRKISSLCPSSIPCNKATGGRM